MNLTFYQTAGGGPALVFIHGGPADSRLRDDRFGEFSGRFRVLAGFLRRN